MGGHSEASLSATAGSVIRGSDLPPKGERVASHDPSRSPSLTHAERPRLGAFPHVAGAGFF